ncbi:hypothetical protein QYG89_06640 [Bacillus sp. B190/17]|uniref:Uncharacterized protein n=1 Tax=Bacillus lumedeiriae TaxID=3058829 RepID=A0ABW8I9G4_9BACI
MNHFRFFVCQLILFSAMFVANVYFDEYISPPFTRVDFIAICLSLPFFIIFFALIDKPYKRFQSIRLRYKIVLSILAFIMGVLLIGFLENVWFEIKGERLFF